MRFFPVFLISFFMTLQGFSQVEFVSRFEVESEYFDPLFEMVRTDDGMIAFRTIAKRAFSGDRVFQYMLFDQELNTESGMIELPVQQGFDMIGYDLDGTFLYILFQKGTGVIGDKYVRKIDLVSQKGFDYDLDNLLDLELREFLVQNDRVIFMGVANMRPAVQVYSLVDKSVHTVQGVYGNDTQILQIRKMPEVEAFEVVISRDGPYRSTEVILNTYDLLGNLLREVKVDKFGEENQEIIEAVVVEEGLYRKEMYGSFGLARRDAYL